MKNKIVLSLFLSLIFPFGAKAAIEMPAVFSSVGIELIINPLECEDIYCLITLLTNYLFIIAFLLAPVLILVAAFYFVTSGGNPDRVAYAKKIIFNAVIGLLVISLARAFVSIIQSLFSA